MIRCNHEALECAVDGPHLLFAGRGMSVREGKRRMRAREERRKTNPGIVCAEMTDDVVKDIIKGRTGSCKLLSV